MHSVLRLTCLASAVVYLSAAPSSFLVFEPSGGKVRAIARSPQGAVAFDVDGAILAPSDGAPVRMRIGGARQVAPELLDRQPSYSNYFVGRESAQWRTRVPHFGKVRYRSVLPGIDVVYYGAGGTLEYDFIVAPEANPDTIEIAFEGAERVRTSKGDLLVETAGGTIRHLRPRVYQTVGGKRIEIAGGYRLKTGGRVGFELARYDRTRELIVDPVVQFTNYVGRTGQETSVGVAVDGDGNVFVAGETNSTGFATATAYQPQRAGETDAYVVKYTNSGALLWVTYFGGNGQESALGVATDAAGSAYITGFTQSTDLPVRGPQNEPGGGTASDGFVAKFSPGGNSLVYATYLGGNGTDWPRGIAVDAFGGAWITGWTTSRNFPVVAAYQGGAAGGGGDAFVTRIAPAGNELTYSSYFGGEAADFASSIAVDASGAVYVSGQTASSLFPVVGSAQRSIAGEGDAFVFKLNPARNDFFWAVLLGGSADDYAVGVRTDDAGNAYVVGRTRSANFPVSRGAFQPAIGGGYDMFIAKIDGGDVAYSTFLGGSGDDWPGGIAVGEAGSAYVSGWTNSPNFPVRNAAQTAYAGGTSRSADERFDAVSARLSPAGDTLLYSTYFGGRGEDKAYGIALDRAGQVWLTGTTTSPDLPSAAGQFSEGELGQSDAFLTRLSSDAGVVLLSTQPSTLRATLRLGDSIATRLNLEVRSTAGATQFTATSNAPWIEVTPQSGNTPATVTVAINPASLPLGTARAEIAVRSGTQTLTVPVTVNVVAAPVIRSTEPATLSPGTLNTTVTLLGGGFTPASRVEVNDTPAIVSFIDQQTMRVVIPPSLVSTEGAVRIAVVNADARSVDYTLRVVSDVPVLTPAGVVNAATWRSGPVSPGQLVIIGGSGFGDTPLVTATPAGGIFGRSLANARVLFDGEPAPVLWVKSGQLAAVVPFGVAGRSAAQVAVEYRGRASAPVSVPIQAASPGLFTANGAGTGAVAALNQDGSLNAQSNPAERGSVIVLYATGLGVTSPLAADGTLVSGTEIRAQLPISVMIGGREAAVEYAGGVPGLVAGMYQINVRVPAEILAGEVPVMVTAGNLSSPAAGITVWVR